MKQSKLNQRISVAAVNATKNNRKTVNTSKVPKNIDKSVSANFALKAKK